MTPLHATYIGGPTALIELGGLRLLTDPTFDPGGVDYPTAAYTLHKTQPPAIPATELGVVDAVLLSHDHHFDNLDTAGRALLSTAKAVYTTVVGAERLGAGATGLKPGDHVPLSPQLRLTATPGRHGPAAGDRGPVVGFLLIPTEGPTVYVSGDTVWYEEVAALGKQGRIDWAFLNLGAAKVAVAGPAPLTFTAAEAVRLAEAWPETRIVPLHFEGWAHFSEGAGEVKRAFAAARLEHRLHWLSPGVRTRLA
jgi:L-ascorbate metabolism protein UlaG (beta-lactamase superfamily)